MVPTDPTPTTREHDVLEAELGHEENAMSARVVRRYWSVERGDRLTVASSSCLRQSAE